MISPLQIALQGLAPGSPPIQIATQGLIIQITAPEAENDGNWIPLRSYGAPNSEIYDSRQPKKKTKKSTDCVVQVTGVRGTLSCTKANVRRLALEARIVPILAAHCLRYWRWKRLCAEKKAPSTAAARAQTAARTNAKRAADRAANRAAKILRDDANEFAGALKPTDLPNVARMLYFVTQENRELRKTLKKKAP